MPLLKRKAEKTTIISVRVPVSTKEQMDTMRKLADDKGFDLAGSLSDAIIKWMRQVFEELSNLPAPTHPVVNKPPDEVSAPNGSDTTSA
jgi:hypothetical protein